MKTKGNVAFKNKQYEEAIGLSIILGSSCLTLSLMIHPLEWLLKEDCTPRPIIRRSFIRRRIGMILTTIARTIAYFTHFWLR